MNATGSRGTCSADDVRRTPRTDPPARRAYGLAQIVLLLAPAACARCAAGCGDGGVRRAVTWAGRAAGPFPVGIGVIVLVSWLRTRRERGCLGRGA
jgi:hypothetical protein